MTKSIICIILIFIATLKSLAADQFVSSTMPTLLGAPKIDSSFATFSCFDGNSIPEVIWHASNQPHVRIYIDTNASDGSLKENEVRVKLIIHADKTAVWSFIRVNLKPQFKNDLRCKNSYLSGYELGGHVTLFRSYTVNNVERAVKQLTMISTVKDFYLFNGLRGNDISGSSVGYSSSEVNFNFKPLVNSSDLNEFIEAVSSTAQKLDEIYKNINIFTLPLSRRYLINFSTVDP